MSTDTDDGSTPAPKRVVQCARSGCTYEFEQNRPHHKYPEQICKWLAYRDRHPEIVNTMRAMPVCPHAE